MRRVFVLTVILLSLTAGILAQGLPDIGITSNLAVGVVKATGTQKLVLETKDGRIDTVFQSITQFKRLSPEKLSLKDATESTLADIGVGDRVLVTGTVSEDKKTIYANKIFLVKGSDLEEQANKQRMEWQSRGVSGKVTEIDPVAKTISVSSTNVIGAETNIKVSAKPDGIFKRYAEGSSRYSEALESSFDQISVGDTFQALGDKSEDGTTFAAEEVLSGSFITVAGAVKSVNVELSEVTIADLGTKKDVTIKVIKSSLLKEFPAEQAQRLARFQAMRAARGGESTEDSGDRPARRGGREGGRRGPGGGMGRGPGDLNQMISRLPDITVTDIKVGDVIAVSSSKPKDPTRVTAIKLLSGVGPFLTAKSGTGGGRSVSGGITIPGLEGADF